MHSQPCLTARRGPACPSQLCHPGLGADRCPPSAAAGSVGANLGPSVLKLPFPAGRAEATAPLPCAGSKAVLLPAAAAKHGPTLSRWPVLHVASVKKIKYVKKIFNFLVPELFS